MKCFKCGTEEGRIVVHHLGYKPEVVVECCWPCHQTIHHRIRKNNECSISVKETKRLSTLSTKNRYIRCINFCETLTPNIRLMEVIQYNTRNGNPSYTSCFIGNHGNKLLEVHL